ncbi:MAG: cobyrinate a,c-diamide synthase [Butyrivibrio sp.]|nr:cobyrinate a,c-diamide synthase [Butyrivibrio sp.]
MGEINAKRIMIAAASSGSGKTTITCALLEALKKRGLSPVSFKCGPDFIDPLFHKKVLGIDSRNLDTFFAGINGIQAIMSECGDNYAVIEGVMGLYDGKRADTLEGSGYEAAVSLSASIILVVDASGAGRTVISVIKGMLLDDTHHLIRGILLNRISEGFYESLKPVLEKELATMRSDVKVLGFFPKDRDVQIGSRHLGLVLPYEISDMKNVICHAASVLEKNADVDGIVALMEESQVRNFPNEESLRDTDVRQEDVCVKPSAGGSDLLTLAVAYDEAFCFYYSENLDMFRKRGVEIRFFSPLRDESLPGECDGILIGGGYPENHLKELSGNRKMLEAIRHAIYSGIPSLAECGGFMYLHRIVADTEGTEYELVGAIDGECRYTDHLVRFGYMQIEAENFPGDGDELSASLVGMKGHEFHYYDSSENGDSFTSVKPGKNNRWQCMVMDNNGFWGFPHFYYPSAPAFVDNFIRRMSEVKNGLFQ